MPVASLENGYTMPGRRESGVGYSHEKTTLIRERKSLFAKKLARYGSQIWLSVCTTIGHYWRG